MRAFGMRRAAAVVDQRLDIACDQRIVDPVGEFLRVLRIADVLAEFVQIVGETAGTDQQHAALAQGGQRLAETQGAGRIDVMRQRYLEYRHVGLREQIAQGHPGPVVQAAMFIEADLEAGFGKQRRGLAGQFRRTRCGVLQLIQRCGEAAEVVDRFRGGTAADAHAAGLPVWRDHEHGADAA